MKQLPLVDQYKNYSWLDLHLGVIWQFSEYSSTQPTSLHQTQTLLLQCVTFHIVVHSTQPSIETPTAMFAETCCSFVTAADCCKSIWDGRVVPARGTRLLSFPGSRCAATSETVTLHKKYTNHLRTKDVCIRAASSESRMESCYYKHRQARQWMSSQVVLDLDVQIMNSARSRKQASVVRAILEIAKDSCRRQARVM